MYTTHVLFSLTKLQTNLGTAWRTCCFGCCTILVATTKRPRRIMAMLSKSNAQSRLHRCTQQLGMIINNSSLYFDLFVVIADVTSASARQSRLVTWHTRRGTPLQTPGREEKRGGAIVRKYGGRGRQQKHQPPLKAEIPPFFRDFGCVI